VGPIGEDDLAGRPCVKEARDALARLVMSGGRRLRTTVDTVVNFCARLDLEAAERP